MLVPAYDLLFGKLALRNLFEEYFEQAGHLNTRIMLKPLEDPHVDLIATVSSSASITSFSSACFYSFVVNLIKADTLRRVM